jgi:hypothetical protein
MSLKLRLTASWVGAPLFAHDEKFILSDATLGIANLSDLS